MAKYFFIGGAQDAEMRMIEEVVRNAGLPFAYATTEGKPCHPGNAYTADTVEVPVGRHLVVVECDPKNVGNFSNVVRIDHHRPQDPGFHMGAAEYWEAASIGQLYRLLGLEPTQEARIMAAFDHCFPAAVRGECPGVTAEEVLSLKVREIADGTGTNPTDVEEQIAFYRQVARVASTEVIGQQPLADLRNYYLGEGYSLYLLAAQVAVTIEGYAALLRHRDRVGDPEKITVTGHARPETVQAFLDDWAPAHGLVRLYGVPTRGYAGGYIT
jgi:hypothetical protein